MSKNVNETNALLVDAGQSSVRFRYIQGAHETEWDLEKIDTAKSVPEQLIQRLHHFFEEAQDTPDVVAISSTGISDQSAASKLIFDYVSAHGGRKVMLAHDSIGGYLSCLNTDLGAMSAVGTGVVTLALGASGFSRVDGWGNLIGDAGSGFWIGRLALESAMRAYDGRGDETQLMQVMMDTFPDLENAYLDLQSDEARVSRIASFAKVTIELSDSDAVARQILTSAVHEITISIFSALKRSGFQVGEPANVSWTGKVARSDRFSSMLQSRLLAAWPELKIIEPKGEPIDGVATLIELGSGNPMLEHVTVLGT
jgi:glucosamine kinase